MKLPLTKIQFETLDYIKKFTRKKGYCPSYRELMKHFGLKSNASMWERINNLVIKGRIKHKKNTKRQIIWLKLKQEI